MESPGRQVMTATSWLNGWQVSTTASDQLNDAYVGGATKPDARERMELFLTPPNSRNFRLTFRLLRLKSIASKQKKRPGRIA